MGWFSFLFMNFSDGCRKAMHLSYQKHHDLAYAGSAPIELNPHHAGLFGALGTRYNARGVLPRWEHVLWAELTPFLLMSKEESIEALTEYLLWQERPVDAKKDWLAMRINQVLSSKPIDSKDSFYSLTPLAFLNNVKWCELLDPATRNMLSAEAEKF